jgi:hypothetical protein
LPFAGFPKGNLRPSGLAMPKTMASGLSLTGA